MLVACNNNHTSGCRRNRFSPIIRSFKAFKNTVPSSDRGLTDFNGYHLETDESQIAFLYLLYLYYLNNIKSFHQGVCKSELYRRPFPGPRGRRFVRSQYETSSASSAAKDYASG